MFVVAIPVYNQHDVTEKYLESWFALAKRGLRVLFIDNGSDIPLSEQGFIGRWSNQHSISIIRNKKNTGVYPTFQQAYENIGVTNFIFYSHNDVEMLEYGWDEKLNSILSELCYKGNPGVCGMYGAKGIGTPDIYKAPYKFTQLMRWNCITVPSMVHSNERVLQGDYERVVTLDGFTLVVSKKMVREVMKGHFDIDRYPVHHNYDNDICVTSHLGGYENYVLDIDCKHHGGMTSTREKWAEEMNTTDLAVHRKAHEIMYEKFRNRLPISVP